MLPVILQIHTCTCSLHAGKKQFSDVSKGVVWSAVDLSSCPTPLTAWVNDLLFAKNGSCVWINAAVHSSCRNITRKTKNPIKFSGLFLSSFLVLDLMSVYRTGHSCSADKQRLLPVSQETGSSNKKSAATAARSDVFINKHRDVNLAFRKFIYKAMYFWVFVEAICQHWIGRLDEQIRVNLWKWK